MTSTMYWQDIGNCLVLFSSKIYPKKNIKIQINNHAYCQSSTFLMAKKDNKREFLIKKMKAHSCNNCLQTTLSNGSAAKERIVF